MSPSRVNLAQRAISAPSNAPRGLRAAQPPKSFLHVEQAEIIFAALADDNARAPLFRIAHQPCGFLIQVAAADFSCRSKSRPARCSSSPIARRAQGSPAFCQGPFRPPPAKYYSRFSSAGVQRHGWQSPHNFSAAGAVPKISPTPRPEMPWLPPASRPHAAPVAAPRHLPIPQSGPTH